MRCNEKTNLCTPQWLQHSGKELHASQTFLDAQPRPSRHIGGVNVTNTQAYHFALPKLQRSETTLTQHKLQAHNDFPQPAYTELPCNGMPLDSSCHDLFPRKTGEFIPKSLAISCYSLLSSSFREPLRPDAGLASCCLKKLLLWCEWRSWRPTEHDQLATVDEPIQWAIILLDRLRGSELLWFSLGVPVCLAHRGPPRIVRKLLPRLCLRMLVLLNINLQRDRFY